MENSALLTKKMQSITTTVGTNEMINNPTGFINESSRLGFLRWKCWKHSKNFFTVRTGRVLDTFKNSAVNVVFPVRPIVVLPTYVFQILRED